MVAVENYIDVGDTMGEPYEIGIQQVPPMEVFSWLIQRFFVRVLFHPEKNT